MKPNRPLSKPVTSDDLYLLMLQVNDRLRRKWRKRGGTFGPASEVRILSLDTPPPPRKMHKP